MNLRDGCVDLQIRLASLILEIANQFGQRALNIGENQISQMVNLEKFEKNLEKLEKKIKAIN